MSESTGRGRSVGRVVVIALITGMAGACGVSTEDHPRPIDPTQVAPAPTPTVTVVPDPPSTPPATVNAPTSSGTTPGHGRSTH
ncbi:hypothetical protein LWC33_24985 [Pseudonocardia sp. RS11V-5]|uniref:hypothetical protein n=1 Tax=Pseudonocardia terrae TaxID=2905831 RepID=UPI001E359D1B|nr:hypothetical protein [Pseudonocardia terrae]MCE3554699.1 hypothetical protein [Pseudonocardia terrae]